eukprot:scaffold47396_cov67-Phaeocystis_antarctica.AAC.5
MQQGYGCDPSVLSCIRVNRLAPLGRPVDLDGKTVRRANARILVSGHVYRFAVVQRDLIRCRHAGLEARLRVPVLQHSARLPLTDVALDARTDSESQARGPWHLRHALCLVVGGRSLGV